MKIKTLLLLSLLIVYTLTGCNQKQSFKSNNTESWEQQLSEQIKLFGHRNWIVVADAAYPLQSNPGIKTILSDENQLKTLQIVNDIISMQSHVKPNIFLDKEIDFVAESDANGIQEYREALDQLFGTNSEKRMHEEIISELDKASGLFNVLIIKTDFNIPYTSVFFQLDCKYWNADAEQKLRKKLNNE